LNSVDTWTHGGQGARGYLHFLEGFMKRSGLRVEARSVGEASDDEFDEEAEHSSAAAEEAELTRLGEAWLATEAPLAKKEFEQAARSRLHEGKAGLVIEVCERLIGLAPGGDTHVELDDLLQEAWGQQRRLGLKP
jgi:hypothetical protein